MNNDCLLHVGEYFVDGKLLPKGGTVLEVGARYFILSKAMLEMGLKHIICEPDKRVRFEKKEGLTVFQEVVVGKSSGPMELSLCDNPEGNFLKTNVPFCKWKVVGKVVVPAVTVREILARCGVARFDLIALDCEGSEEQILLSLKGDEARQVVVEHHHHAGRSDALIQTILDHMRNIGFVERLWWKVPWKGIFIQYRLFVHQDQHSEKEIVSNG